MSRYLCILGRFWKNSLLREMSFRGHFAVNVFGELLWVVLLLVFIDVIYSRTPDINGWTEAEYLFLTGTHLLVTGLFEAFFFENCWRISGLVRRGDLDFVLLKPANTQFLLSFQQISYSSLANAPVGIGVCLYALRGDTQGVSAGQWGWFCVLVAAGVVVLYSVLFMFALTSVWLIRQTGVDHLWFYAVSLARYPAEIYRRFVGGALYFSLVFVVPLLLVSNLPANVVVRTVEPWMVAYLLSATAVLLSLSGVVLRAALRSYRSASS
ncbi:MAG: hypothetical protein HOP29_01480 [Phycisphaerales bacterium]|nr:hypothetical protein [Phycisphaerales bacterium]